MNEDLQWFLYVSAFVVFLILVILGVWWLSRYRRQTRYVVAQDGLKVPMSPSTLAAMDAYCNARRAAQQQLLQETSV